MNSKVFFFFLIRYNLILTNYFINKDIGEIINDKKI